MRVNYDIKNKNDKETPDERKKIVLTETVETVKEISVDELIRKVNEINSGIERLQARKQKLVQEINEIVDQTGIKLSNESKNILK